MFASSYKENPEARLEIRSKAGVLFRVLDALDFERANGVGSTTLHLPHGLYTVEWQSGSIRSQSHVRLIETGAIAVFPDPKDTHDVDLVEVVGTHVVRHFTETLSSRRIYGAAIVVTISLVSDDRTSLEALRLYDTCDFTLRTNSDTDRMIMETGVNEVTCVYSVRPGGYVLAFRSITGELLQQSVPALDSRTTLVFIHEVQGKVLLASGEEFESVHRSGIDPARTVMITIDEIESRHRVREHIRLVTTLLNAISHSQTVVDPDFVKILDHPKTDPLLRYLATTQVLMRLNLGLSPDPHVGSSERSTESGAKLWAERAMAWLELNGGSPIEPDMSILLWHLEKYLGRSLTTAKVVRRPPMLSVHWRWAIERSIEYPRALPASLLNVAATRGATAADPWLCWRASAAKAAPRKSNSSDQLDDLSKVVVEKASVLAASAGHSGLHSLVETLSPEAAVAVTGLTSVDPQDVGRKAADIAILLGLPGSAMRSMLETADSQITSAIAAAKSMDGRIAIDRGRENWPKPKLRPIDNPDDPQAGRFGGSPERAGFLASASFSNAKSKNWIRILITVEGPARNNEPVGFFLHDSFDPQVIEKHFKRGRARLAITAWGGFTVGIWLPRREVKLELNLATVIGAPDVIRLL